MPKTTHKPPKHLSAASAAWFVQVVEGFDMDHHHVRLLTLACEAWDRAQQSREALAVNGLTYTDRFDQPHSRPEVAIERDSRIAFARLVRELGLDAAQEPSRPPVLRHSR